MAITTYAELQSAVIRWIHRSDLEAVAPDFIALGEARIYRELRIRCMETALSTAIASGVVAVPSGYVELKHARIDGSDVKALLRKSDEWIYANYPTRSADGEPKFIARDGENFIFGPYPDSGYTLKGTYYKRLDALSAANTTNWFTTNAPDLLLFAALAESAPYTLKDDRVPLWESKYASVRDQLAAAERREAFSGSPLTMTAR